MNDTHVEITQPDSAKQADRPHDGVEAQPLPVVEIPEQRNNLSVGNIHLGAAAFAVLFVSTVAAYLAWLAGVVVPPDVLVPTGTLVGTTAGWLFPSS